MQGHGEKMSRKKEAAIAALLACESLEKAAAKSGVSVATLRRWRNEESFRQSYEAARTEILEKTVNAILQTTATAVATLYDSLKAQKSGDRIKAAIALLDQAAQLYRPFNLDAQLAEIKALMKRNEQRKKGFAA